MKPRSAIRFDRFYIALALWIAFVWAILSVAVTGVGFLAYRVIQDPDAVAASAGHLLGIAFRSASEGASK
jgi:hypothetical protein